MGSDYPCYPFCRCLAGTQDAIHSAQACLWALTCSSAELFEPGCGTAYFPTSLLHNQAAWQEPASHPLIKAVRCRAPGMLDCLPRASSVSCVVVRHRLNCP